MFPSPVKIVLSSAGMTTVRRTFDEFDLDDQSRIIFCSLDTDRKSSISTFLDQLCLLIQIP